jgi:GntR family transcriptional regulator/MocR family aminotransferase
MDLHLELERGEDLGVRDGLERALRKALADGRIPPGTRLPPTRALAEDLGLSRGTVVDAYGQLTAEGRLIARQGSGTYVGETGTLQLHSPAMERFSRPGSSNLVLPFQPGTPDLIFFPRKAWIRALSHAIAEIPDQALGYGDPRGPEPVRQVLGDYLARVRGVITDPDSILLTTGLAQALSLTASVLRERGESFTAVEDPGSSGFPTIFRNAGHHLVGIPVDRSGVDVSQLVRSAATSVITTPAHQFPLGVVLSPERRLRLVEWAADGGLIIEDDYDAEFRYDRRPVGALQSLAPQRVVYTGSVSKTLAPGLRAGWLVAPDHLRDDLIEQKAATDLGSPTVGMYALAELIRSGAYDRHLRKLRHHYRKRRDAVVAVFARHPWITPSGISAGQHLVGEMANGTDAGIVVVRTLDRGLGIRNVSDYSLEHSTINGIVIGYGASTAWEQSQALRTLDSVLAEFD